MTKAVQDLMVEVARVADAFHAAIYAERGLDEDMVSFTHDRELPWLLPGLAPTGRRAEILAMSVVSVRRSLVTSHRTLRDYHGLLGQLGLSPARRRADRGS